MKFKATNIALGVDVWNEIEAELKTGLKGVSYLRFTHSVDRVSGVVKCLENNETVSKRFEIDKEASEKLVIRLCERFNVEWRNIRTFRLKLKPGEVPVFDIEVHPFVDCASTLDTTKSRMNPITID